MANPSSSQTTSRRDLVAGIVLVLIGSGILTESLRYSFGTLARMGPGYYPAILGCILILLGVLVVLTRTAQGGEEADEGEASEPFSGRGVACILLGILSFIVLGTYAGFAPASFACVFISALGDRSATLKQAATLALGATVLGALLFSYGLQLQFPLWRFGG